MRRIIGLAAAFPRSVLLSLLALTLFAAYWLPGLQIRVSAESMMAENDPARLLYEQSQKRFGASSNLVVVIHDALLPSYPKLRMVQQLVDKLEASPYVDTSDSLFSVQRGQDIEGEIHFAPYLAAIPREPESIAEIFTAAHANPFVGDNLLSRDGLTLAINLHISPKLSVTDEQLAADIQHRLLGAEQVFERAFVMGLPQTRVALSQLIQTDQQKVLPLSLVVLLLVLLLALRRWESALLPLLTAIASVIWTLAFMAATGISVNVMTSIVPALLVVIGSTEDVHLLAAYLNAIDKGKQRPQAVASMASNTSLAILLTFVTTYMGFLSIALNDISLLREFALVASTGLAFNFVITTLLVPAALASFGSQSPTPRRTEADTYQRMALNVYRWVDAHPRAVVFGSLLAGLIAVGGMLQVKVDTDTLDYFSPDAPLVRNSAFLHEELAGMHRFDVVFDSGIGATFQQVRYLEQIDKLQQYLNQRTEVDKTLSFADMVKLVNQVMEALEADELWLPTEDEILREYLLFLNPQQMRGLVSEDFSSALLIVRHNLSSSRELRAFVEDVEAFIQRELDPALGIRITGESVLTANAADSMAQGQAESLALMIIVIFAIVTVLFLNWKAGLLAVVTNTFPILLLFGVMGYFDIPLNTGTAMVAAIAISISVDDTMHFLVRYHENMRANPSSNQAIIDTLLEEAKPIASTTLALALGFAVLAISSFPPVVHFGLLSALVIVVALLANFVIAPLLLGYVRLITVWDLIGVEFQASLQQSCPLFKGMNRFEVRKLIAISQPVSFKAGDAICREGESGDEMYVIIDGSVDVEADMPEGGSRRLSRLHSGDVFGELALMTTTARVAHVIAREDTRVLALSWHGLQRVGRYMPRTSALLFENVARIVGQRLIEVEMDARISTGV